jgi:hypothetical protein
MSHCALGLLVMLVGFGTSVSAVALGLSWWRMKGWMRLSARVKGASLDTRYIPISAGFVREEFRPRIEYEYEYRGRRYVNRRLTFRDARLWTYEKATAERQLIEPGTELRVCLAVEPVQGNHESRVRVPVHRFSGDGVYDRAAHRWRWRLGSASHVCLRHGAGKGLRALRWRHGGWKACRAGSGI